MAATDIAHLDRLAEELNREADALYERADGNRRRAEALQWQGFMASCLERQPPAARSSLLFQLLQADLLLCVVEYLYAVSDRLALASVHPLLRAYRMRSGEAWLCCGPHLTLTRHLDSVAAAEQLASGLGQCVECTEVHLRYSGVYWGEVQLILLAPLNSQLGDMPHLVILTIEANSAPLLLAHELLPYRQLDQLVTLRLSFLGNPVLFYNAFISLPQLQRAELQGIHFKPPRPMQLTRTSSMLDEVCAGGQLTSLTIHDSNLTEAPAHFLRQATQLRHLNLRYSTLPRASGPAASPS